MPRHVWYAEYQENLHLYLILRGWKEDHCLYVDGVVMIKLVKL